ncbi:DUF1634 domain-containing protein [Fructilactobacillus fructivorans]|uniref:DUF1634 domain-containing protein n=1 Tax=Fructilactobacillus fructivorans TaxID=1614 RepID=UPI0007055859|nr:DUF1634 domain-containing protein [Fructilactobacillus fructivorans]KRN40378.1 hypothetical protein IV51_GL000084 [Fructilactobacillus fructivorans]KRN42075.1 hypothetical protein IV48_GL000648 [Fructilactobacillus fructivorans]
MSNQNNVKNSQAEQKAKNIRIEQLIGKIMRIGVIISVIIMLFGLVLYIVTGTTGFGSHYYLTSFSQLLKGIISLKPYSIMMLGVFALILTPVLRVVVSIYSFYKEHDKMYVIITTIVFIILLISFFLGTFLHL